MQFRDIHGLKKLLTNKTFHQVLKWLLILLIILFIFQSLIDEKQLGKNTLNQLIELSKSGRLYLFIFPVLLAGLNWLIETYRWQMLAGKIEKISLISAFNSVLAGQSLSFITPQSIGDYLGRILHMDQKNRSEAIGAVMFGRWAQTLITGMFGSIGLVYVIKAQFKLTNFSLMILAVVTICFWLVIIHLFVVKRGLLVNKIQSLIGEKWSRYIVVLNAFQPNESMAILLLTALRYFIFSTQFVLIYLIFDTEVIWGPLIGGITWMFLLKSIIPAINIFADLSVRELAVVYFFNLYPATIPVIILSSFFLWVINILIPTVIGIIQVYRLKLAFK